MISPLCQPCAPLHTVASVLGRSAVNKRGKMLLNKLPGQSRCTCPASQRPIRSAYRRLAVQASAAPESKERKSSPLSRGGSLTGEKAAGKDAGKNAASGVLQGQKVGAVLQIKDDKFEDFRWKEGRWDLDLFKNKETNQMDWKAWDSVIDAEMGRRQVLEENPVASINEGAVVFDTSEVPWWAWVRRFHLPEAEKLNGRAAMVGYAIAWFVDSLSGWGLVDQQNSFLGKFLLHIAVFAILIFRNLEAIPKYKGLLEEATFYDKQWSATWEGQERPKESEAS